MFVDRRTLLRTAAAVPVLALAPRLAQAAPEGRINYWHHLTSESEFKGLEAVMALFLQRYPGLSLTQENIPNPEYMSKITAAVVSGSKPDTAMVIAERVNDMVGMGGLIDLTDRIKGWDKAAAFPEDRWTGASVGDKVYGIPAFTFVDWMYYRKDWFDEAGISGPPKTLAEFQDAAIKLTDPAKGRYGFGLRGGAGGYQYVVDMIESFGSPIVVDGKPAMDKPKAVEAVTFLSELFTRHKACPPSAPNDSYRQIMEAFKTGQTAMVWHHTGSLAEISGAMKPGQFMTAARPAGPGAHIARLTYLFNGLMSDANADAAWAWLTFWAEPDAAIAFLEQTGYFPASPQTASDSRITGNPLYGAAVETTKFGRLPPRFIGSAGWDDNVVLPEFQKVLVGRSTPEACVDAMMAGLEAALQ